MRVHLLFFLCNQPHNQQRWKLYYFILFGWKQREYNHDENERKREDIYYYTLWEDKKKQNDCLTDTVIQSTKEYVGENSILNEFIVKEFKLRW